MATAPRKGEYMHDLLRYLERNLSKGYNPTELRVILERQGYSRSAVERAFKIYGEKSKQETKITKQEIPKTEAVMPDKKEKRGFLAGILGLFKKK